MVDPFGRAIADFHRGEQTEPLVQRDGQTEIDHPIEELYFQSFEPDSAGDAWIESYLSGPLLDVGAGAGRHSRYFQDRFETVAIEVSENLVETMRDRGVEDARLGDMFDLREDFGTNRFAAVLSIGTQIGLAGSLPGVESTLDDLAFVTESEATAIVDNYDPTEPDVTELLGYREDVPAGLAFRVMHFEYEGVIGPTLLFRLFSPDRLREAASETPWSIVDVDRPADNSFYYRAALSKA